jgi:hypothetical protein
VFVDNAGSLRCACSICRRKWRKWIGGRYTAAERQELFGAADPAMGVASQPGLLWAETQRFRCVQCLRRNVRPILCTRPGYNLPRTARRLLEMNLASAALGNAEAAAFGGGGGFLQGTDPALMEVQKQYRRFFERHAALYEGLDSLAEVAVFMSPG